MHFSKRSTVIPWTRQVMQRCFAEFLNCELLRYKRGRSAQARQASRRRRRLRRGLSHNRLPAHEQRDLWHKGASEHGTSDFSQCRRIEFPRDCMARSNVTKAAACQTCRQSLRAAHASQSQRQPSPRSNTRRWPSISRVWGLSSSISEDASGADLVLITDLPRQSYAN